MSVDRSTKVHFDCLNESRVKGDLYSVYFGLGHCIELIDDPAVFKVSLAGEAFGSLIARYVTEECKGFRFLDLGTGSGVHSLLLKSMGAISVTGSDISREAVAAAKKNEFHNFGVNTIEFACGDLFQGLPEVPEKYDLILFNPPGWRTPSDSFLEVLDRSNGEGLAIDSMFYGDRTLERFFESLPKHLIDGGKVLLGLNSLVGIRQVMRRLRDLHEERYVINCRLLERHDLPLLLYSEKWARIQDHLIEEILSWTREGDAYCSREENGQIIWCYEIVELTLWKR
ncbi:methyltransferase [Pseudomonas umsongensis]